MTIQSIDQVKQIIEDADAESQYGIEWHADRELYLQVSSSAGWEEGMRGVTVDAEGRVWISGDSVSESAQDMRVEGLLEAGYSTELAQTQRYGYDEEEAKSILG